MEKTNKLGLVGRCFLAGVTFVGGVLGVFGCDSSGNLYSSSQMAVGSVAAQHVATTNQNLTPNQMQSFGVLGSLLGIVSPQEAMREAEREGRSEGNVYGGNSNKDVVYLKDGGIIEGEIVLIDSFDIKIRKKDFHEELIPKSRIKSYIDR